MVTPLAATWDTFTNDKPTRGALFKTTPTTTTQIIST